VIVAVAAVRVVQVAADDIVHMIAVRNRRVSAIGSMDVIRGFLTRAMVRRALIWIGGGNADDMFVCMGAVGMVQMAAIKVIGVPVMLDREVAAVGAVLMLMRLGMFGVRSATGEAGQWQNEK
jgi:hypothetical protein